MLQRHALLAACGLGLSSAALHAATINEGTYHLNNHPDGSAAEPHYGLRLDEFINVTRYHDIWTFDFEHEGSAMYLDYKTVDGNKELHIYGTSFGGLDVGDHYSAIHSGYYDIDFTYNMGVDNVPGDDDLWATGNQEQMSYLNHGTIGEHYEEGGEGDDGRDLYDFAGDNGFTFRLGDENDDNGHRGFDGISGWGWLNYQAGPGHIDAGDWLFTVGSPVPAPGAIGLGAIGLALVSRFRKNKEAKTA